MKPLLTISALLLLAGCIVEPMPEPLPDGDACGAAGLQGFVGQDEAILAATTFVAPVRIIRPGTAVTMDFSPGRLNIELDARGKITRVYCG